MKNLFVSLFIISVVSLGLFACGGGGVETSEEMKGFMEMFDGVYESTGKALDKYAVPEMAENEFSGFAMDNMEATAREGDCYTVEAEAGITTRVYKICWADGKINAIEFLELK